MKDKVRKVIIVIFGIGLNILGRSIAGSLKLPIWLDMVGTFIASYFTGIWGGIVAGISNNLISSFFDVTALVYSLTSIGAAIMIHIQIKKGYMENLLKCVISCFWIGIVCTVVSTPLNLIFYGGYSGNAWGDTLVDMLKWYDISHIWAALAGEVVVEIVDKQVCVMIAYLVIRMINGFKRKKHNAVQSAGIILAVGIAVASAVQPLNIKAAEESFLNDNFIEKIYNNTNGMVSSEANVICETDDGYIWIGSYAGLTRYDGNKFEFIREGGLVNVVGMMTDSRGRLWIGTNDAGIARYENGKYTYFTDKDGLPTNSIRCFAEDKAGNVYVGTKDKICKFSNDDTIEILEQDITFVISMAVYNDMLVVMDNKGDIYAIDGNRKMTLAREASERYFYYCLASTSRGLMVGTDTGELFVLDVSEQGLFIKEHINISAGEISAVFEDSKKRLWIATDSEFGYLDKDNNYNKMYYNGFSSVVYFHEDYQGNIWIASSKYGVMQLSESSFVNLFKKAGIENKVVNAVTYYNNDYYCGTDDGVVIIDGNNLSSKSDALTAKTAGYRVRALFTDSKERLWICTYNGLICYDSDGGMRVYNSSSDGTTSDRFRCITELKDGSVAVGTADGINFIKDGRLTGKLSAKDGLSNTQILSIVEGSDGNIWAGSDGSGIYIISDGRLVRNYTVNDGLSSNVILRIVPHDDEYFVVTSNALCHIDRDGKIRRLSNFPYFNNYDVIINNDTAYITCSAGIYEMKLSELCSDNCGQFMLYGAGEGLFSGLTANSWNYTDKDGRLFLCSNDGVIVFDSGYKNSKTDMKFGICSVECDGREIGLSDGNNIVIPENAEEISIYASVKNYAFAGIKVRFYIKERDDDPKLYDCDEIEPIRLYKSNFSKYNICLQIVDNSGENVLQEQIYTVNREPHAWERQGFKTYIFVVCFEIALFTIISIVGMILFIMRKGELEKLQVELEKRVNEQTGELSLQQERIKKLFVQTVTSLSEAVDAKDRYTSGHSKRVAEYALMIAARMGKSKEEQDKIYRAGLLHDVGKIRIPDEIINKPGKLTDEEFNLIKIHPVAGYHILRGISEDDFMAIAAKYHHERYDGKGYPNGLAGEKIPEVARILAVADSYDAMASNRSYRNALPQDVVRSEIEKGKGTQFDPDIAEIMLQIMDEDKDYKLKQADYVKRRILTVDDEVMNNKIIAHIMRDEPMYEVVSVCSGREALKILEQQSFNLILLDVRMPEMDGLETLKLIREKYQTPVVLMTADKSIDISMEFAKYGCDDYITKPFLPLMLKEVINNMTERTNIENNTNV